MRKLILLIILCTNTLLFSQKVAENKNEKRLIQFSGVVIEKDSLQPIPFANVIITNGKYGTVADNSGYFSVVAHMNDTIIFSEIGYEKKIFIIPDTLTSNRYAIIQTLDKDTVWLKEAVVYPWPTREQFKQIFLNLNLRDDDLAQAQKNLAREVMEDRYNLEGMSSKMNFNNSRDQHYTKIYNANMYPTTNLLNPIAWAQFIQAWKRGDFKSKNKK